MQSLIRNLAMLSVLCVLMATQAAWGVSRDQTRSTDPGAAIRDSVRSQMLQNEGSFNTNRNDFQFNRFNRFQRNNFDNFHGSFNPPSFDFGPWGQTMDRSRSWGPPAGYQPHYFPDNNYSGHHGHANHGYYPGSGRYDYGYGANFGTYYVPNGNYYYYGANPYYSGSGLGIYYQSPTMQFSYGTTYAPWNYPPYGPVYTAPQNPRYGSYNWSYGQGEAAYANPPVTYNDNRTYNYYGTPPESAPAGPAPAAPRNTGAASPALPVQPQATLEPPQGFGVKFFDQTRIDTPKGILAVRFDGTTLVVGVGSGKERALSRAADPIFGAIALYVPGEGVALIFREDDTIMAAYPTDGGKWWFEPLPYAVNFRNQVNLGMVNGTPWVVFDSTNGARYVVSFTSRHWQEVGSGTR